MPQTHQESRCTLEPAPELRRRIHDGEPEALAEAVELFHAGALRYARVLMRQEAAARAAVRDTFLRLVARHPQAAPERPLRAWIFEVCREACLDHLGLARQHQARGVDLVITRTELNALQTDLSQSWEEAARRDHEARLLGWLAGLAELRKTIVFLHLFENYAFREVAEITGMPAASVVMVYYRAMSEFKVRLAQPPAGERPEWAAWSEAPPELSGEIAGRARALIGTLALVEGEAAVRDPLTGRSAAALPGSRFARDGVLEVRAGHVLLRLGDGSDLWVPAGTELDFSAWDAGRREVRLARGLVLALAARDAGKKGTPFLLQTPVASLAAPADAAFEVLAEDGHADVALFHGALDCQTNAGQARARRGDGVRVEAGGPPLVSQLETFRQVRAGTAGLLAASGENPKLRAACRALGKVMRLGKAEKQAKAKAGAAHATAPEKTAAGAPATQTARPRNQTGLLIVLLVIWVAVLATVSLYWNSRGGIRGRAPGVSIPARSGYTAPGAVARPGVAAGARRNAPPNAGAASRTPQPRRQPAYQPPPRQTRPYVPPPGYATPRAVNTPRANPNQGY